MQYMVDQDPLENLVPILVQSFGVILLGYLSKRLGLVSNETKVLGEYVTKFALPALFFRSMAAIDFFNVNWMFIIAISLAKFILFLVTVLLVIMITRPINLGLAGILSMFITQTNDVALGYPILKQLYPELAEYIYLFAPAQLVLINPICFILLEIHEFRLATLNSNELPAKTVSIRQRILLVIRKVLFNPLVFMTVIGVIFNFIVNHHVPPIIDLLLKILADSFGAVALFYLGINMVGKMDKLNKNTTYILVFLLLGKLILMPLLSRELVVHLVDLTMHNSSQVLNYTLVGFFYGGLPTAPPVFLIASNFQIYPDLIATALVLSTFMAGPLMFISGRIITMMIYSKSQYDNVLRDTATSVSSISIVFTIWVLTVFVLCKRWRSPLHRLTIIYSVMVILSCFGLVIGRIFMDNSVIVNPSKPAGWSHYFQFALFFIGVTGTRISTCFIAIGMFLIKWRNVSFLNSIVSYLIVLCICLPIIVTAILLIFSKPQQIADIDPSFQYGKAQIITSLVILTVSLIVTVVFLILQTRCDKLGQSESRRNQISPVRRLLDESEEDITESSTDQIITLHGEDNLNESNDVHQRNVVTMDMNEDRSIIHVDELKDCQINHHLVLLILLVVTMGFGFFLCLWRIVNETITGIYVELEFLDCAFNFGQGFILWAIFGFDFKLVMNSIRRLKTLWHNISEFYIPPEGHLAPDVVRIRDEFSINHMSKCRKDIGRNVRRGIHHYKSVFTGAEIINWLLQQGLGSTRMDCHGYAQSLLIGRVIESVQILCNLLDDDQTLYRFIELNSNEVNDSELDIIE